ncbi:hypothetical protein ABH922_003195 [Rhodococcus sp. 27YEA15]|uniref:hypothetical protein n=1 Tax=Rhodococcus sp. 27YEA15 TaxID=3156259 RepID=UPI003C7C638B
MEIDVRAVEQVEQKIRALTHRLREHAQLVDSHRFAGTAAGRDHAAQGDRLASALDGVYIRMSARADVVESVADRIGSVTSALSEVDRETADRLRKAGGSGQ